MHYKLENWSVQTTNPYLPLEASKAYLAGDVYGHPKYPDGHRILTSRPIKVDGRVITTYSGSVYELGEPDPKYLEWMNKNGRVYNPEQPIKILTEDPLTDQCEGGML